MRYCTGLHQRSVHLEFIFNYLCSQKHSVVTYTVRAVCVFSSASLFWTFSTESFHVLFYSPAARLDVCHLGDEGSVRSERL